MARPEEYPAVAALTERAYVEGGFTRPDSLYLAQLADAERRAAEAELYLAVDGVDGCSAWSRSRRRCRPTRRPRGRARRPSGCSRSIPARRGAGVGEALVRACIGRARTLGCTMLRLSTQREM